jgi:hypothetical protein
MTGTVADIVNACITELSQVPGLATQIYSADRFRQFVEDALQLELDEMWWPNLMFYQKVALSGTGGLLADDLKGPISFCDDYTNIAGVYPDGSNRKIAELPQSVNPFNLSSGSGIGPIFISPDATAQHRPFKVWPETMTGSVVVWFRQTPSLPLSDDSKVYLDPLLLQFDACWMYAVDDGTVPAQVNRFQMLAAKRRQQMKSAFSQHGLMLDPRFPADPALIQDEFASNSFTVVPIPGQFP